MYFMNFDMLVQNKSLSSDFFLSKSAYEILKLIYGLELYLISIVNKFYICCLFIKVFEINQ
jgi:hypothetical protein